MVRCLISLLIFCVILTGQCPAATIAVFPFEDLSQGRNSINTEFARSLASGFNQIGTQTVAQTDLIEFLARHRIRQLGTLQTKTIQQINSELNADFAVLGTIIEDKATPRSFGATLLIYRTKDAQVAWSITQAVNSLNDQRLLGLGREEFEAEIIKNIARRVVESFAPLVWQNGESLPSVRAAKGPEDDSHLQIETVFFHPKYVKPGETIQCSVRLQPNKNLQDENCKIYIRAGNKVHVASTEDGVIYQAEWIGSETEGHRSIDVAMLDKTSNLVEELFLSETADARYPVNLVFVWPSGRTKEIFLGEYTVDSLPPLLEIKLDSTQRDDEYIFRDQVEILPRFTQLEPITKWQLSIKDNLEETILTDSGIGMLPEKFYWHGQDEENNLVEAGTYTIELKVWDRAGNTTSAQKMVRFYPEVMKAASTFLLHDKQYRLELQPDGDLPVKYWKVEFWTPDNDLLKQLEGTELPTVIDMDWLAASLNNITVNAIVTTHDILGGTAKIQLSNLGKRLINEDQPDDLPAAPQDRRSVPKNWSDF